MTNAVVTTSYREPSTEQTTNPWCQIPDPQLVEFCMQGLEEAWVELLNRYERLILSVLIKTIPVFFRRFVGIQELYQEVIAQICSNSLRVLRELEWRHEGSLRGVLQSISYTVAYDYLRRWLNLKRDVRRELQLDELKYDGKSHNSHSAIEQKIFLEQLARYLAQQISHAPNRTRDIAIFLLYYQYGLRAVDLARIYRLKIKTVESKLARLSRLARVHCRPLVDPQAPARRQAGDPGT